MEKLNVGCGAFKKPGWINLDVSERVRPDVVHDLNSFPYPFAGDRFDAVEADHVLEHLHDVFGAMRELHRVLKDGATLIVRVPHFSRGMTHPDHKRGFDVSFPFYFSPSFQGGYSGVRFDLRKVRLRWFAQPYLKKTVLGPVSYFIGRALGGILDILAGLSPWVCSRLWAFWVGGFEEVEFQLVCRKGAS